jgi:deoxyribodipyrimidine photo-lyase
MTECVIHWFRRDLRLDDNSALAAALRSGDPVLPVFILDDAILSHDIAASRLSFLRTALKDLEQQLRGRGGGLLVRRGDAPRELNRIAEEANAWGVYVNRDHTPYARQRDARATRGLQMTGVVTQTFDDLMLVSPQLMVDGDGLPPADFDEFSHSWLEQLEVEPEPPTAVAGTFAPAGTLQSIDDWAAALTPDTDRSGTQAGATPAGAAPAGAAPAGATPASARRILDELLTRLPGDQGAVNGGEPGPLWAALALGTISVREVARAVLARAAADESSRQGAEAVILGLCRREHAYHLLHAYPQLLNAPGVEGDYVRHWIWGNRLT